MERLNAWLLTIVQGRLSADDVVWLLTAMLLVVIVGALVVLIGSRSD